MTTQYTPILKLALPVTGELSGTWGDVVNDNITSMIEQAVAGLATISTWSGNGHTLTTANGTTSESRCAMLVAQDGSGLSAAGEIVCPASSKLYVLKNATSYAITLKTAAGTGVAVASGDTAFLFCDGTNVNSCVTTIVNGHITGNLTVDGNATINGNTTLGNATSDTVTVTARVASNVLPSADNTYDLGSSGNSWKDLWIDGTATMALVAISGGTINGVSIGATTPATFLAVDNLSLDGNTIASTNTNGNIVIAPNGTGDVQLDADTVRVGDADATVTLTSNGNGALSITTGGTGALTLTTNGGTNSGSITIANGANGNISLIPNGTGDVILSADTVQVGDSNTDAYITTNGTGNLNLTTNNGTNSGTIQIAQGANGNITLTPNGTGSVSIPKLVWSGGTSGRVPYLTTGGQFTDSANLTYDGTTLATVGRLYNGDASTFGASTWGMSLGNGGVSANYFKASTTYWQDNSGTQIMQLGASALQVQGLNNTLNLYYTGTAAGSGNPIYFSSDSGGTNLTYASYSAVLDTASGGTRKGKLYFQTSNGSTPVVRWNIDSWGTLGSGQSNSSWGGSTVPIQMGAAGIIYANTSANYMNIGSNLYYDGSTNRRIVADYVTLYSQLNGNHDFYVGGTGAAGSGITLYNTMRVANTGNLLLAGGGAFNDVSLITTSGNYSITNIGFGSLTQRFNTANYDAIRFQNSAGSQDYVRVGYDLSAGAGSSGIARIEALGAASYVALIANNYTGLTSNYEGNGGLRTTPYAWGTSNIGFDVGSYGGLGQITSVASTVLTQNLYHNGSGFIAKNTGVGSYYQQYNGGHLWYYTPSVSGGASASPALQAFLSSSGQFILGSSTANGATFATASPPNSTIGGQAAFISGAKGAYAGGASLPTGQLMVYDTTTSTAGSGGAIGFGADCGSGQATWIAAIDGRRDSANSGNYGGSLNFYVRPNGSYNTQATETITSAGVHQFLNGGGSLLGQINPDSGYIAIGYGDTGLMFIGATQLRIIPRKPGTPASASDNAIDLGDSGSRFRVIYAGTGTINTSDANEKQDFADISDAERRVAVAVKGLFKSFRFKDAVAQKGDAARIHFGVVAQEVRSAFEAEGLDARRYALFCSDTWYEVNGNRYIDKREVTAEDDGAVERTRLGIRYDELLSFVMCAI